MPEHFRRSLDVIIETPINLVKLGLLGTGVGVTAGIASAVFLYLLDWVTAFREGHPWLLFLLPVAGLFIGWIYEQHGQSVAAGTNLVLERVQNGTSAAIPFRMVPLVFGGTVLTHLFGGSAGREGTAVQMSAALTDLFTRPFRLADSDRRILIMSGISGGFGAVFGTPLAGMMFGVEVVFVGHPRYAALVPCLVASCVGDSLCRALGVQHAVYSVAEPLPDITVYRWLLIGIASVLFAASARGFVWLTGAISTFTKARVKKKLLRPFLGGLAVIGLTYLFDTRDYLGLSLPLIAKSFTREAVPLWAFALKILFTAVTLGSAFKGGEVTPLFCIGATLGAAFGHLIGESPSFFAALGFVAVFAGAANTPITCVLLGVELFGAGTAVPVAAACLIAYALAGRNGIYSAQRRSPEDAECSGEGGSEADRNKNTL